MDTDTCAAAQAFALHARLSRDLAQEVCRGLAGGSAKADVRRALPDMHAARSGHVVVAGSEEGCRTLMVVGGNNREAGRLDACEVLRPSAGAWTAGPRLREKRFLLGGGVTHGGIVAVAGGDDGRSYHKTCEYLPASVLAADAGPSTAGEWCAGPEMSIPRRGCGSAVAPRGAAGGAAAGCLVVAGGCDGREDVSSAEYLDLHAEQWLPLPALPLPGVFCPSLATLDDRVYCVGGFSNTDATKAVYALDLRTDAWAPIRPPMRQIRAGAAACAHLGRIHVVGGQVGNSKDTIRFLNSGEAYCPVAGRWLTTAPLDAPTSGAGLVSCGTHMALVGGAEQREAFASETALAGATIIV